MSRERVNIKELAKISGLHPSSIALRLKGGLSLDEVIRSGRWIRDRKLDHKWNNIGVSEYVKNLMQNEVCKSYAEGLKGSDAYKLIATLTKCRWFSLGDFMKNTDIQYVDIRCHMRSMNK